MFTPERQPNMVYNLVLKNVLRLHFITIEMTQIVYSYLKDIIENWFYNIYSLILGFNQPPHSCLPAWHLKKSECAFFQFQQHQPHHPIIVSHFDFKNMYANTCRRGALPPNKPFVHVFYIVAEIFQIYDLQRI